MTLPRRRFLQAAGAGTAAAALLTALPKAALAATGLVPESTPEPTGQSTTPLDGDWAFATDPGAAGTGAGWQQPGFDDSDWARLPVPGNWDLHDAYANYHGKAWYRRQFPSPATSPGQVVRLRFEAVYYQAQVWFNGTLLGGHSGGYTPFEFDVTSLLATDGPNTVAVLADNTYSIGAWWAWGGISRSVNLTVNEAVRVERQHVITTPDLAAGTAALDVWITVSNASSTQVTVTVAGQVTDTAGTPLTGVSTVDAALTIGARGEAEAHLQIHLPAGSFTLWQLDDPHLYLFATTVTGPAGALAHRRTDRFGIREVRIDGTALLLNGEQVRVNGYNRVGDDRVVGATEPDYLVQRDIDRMKASGANMMRIHHVPQAPNLLDYADEKGLLLIEEIPVWGKGANLDPNDPTTRGQFREMIRRDYNHPSIIAWSVCNEIAGTSDAGRTYVRTMIDWVRHELDSTRLLTYVSNTYSGASTPAEEALQYTDFCCLNMYGNFAGAADHAHQLFPDKPLFVSEFSSDSSSFPTSRELVDFRTTSDAAAAAFPGRPWLVGASLWSFNDYRSGFSGSSVDQVRGWGIQNVWGQRKQAFAQMRAAYAPVRALSVVTSDSADRISLIQLTPRGAQTGDGPAWRLSGYRLAWQVTDATGAVLDGRLLDLADVRPGDPPRSAGVGWHDPGSAVRVTVSLVSPVGYEVAVAVEDLRPPAAPAISATVACAGAVRAVIGPVPGASGYQLVATDGQHTVRSAVSVDTELDLSGLTNGTGYTLTAVAVNAAGTGAPSAGVAVTPTAGAGALPPVVQDLVPVDGGLVLGFVVAPGCSRYQVQAVQDGTVVRDYTTTLVGSTRIDALAGNGPYQVRIRGLSATAPVTAWSQWRTARPHGPADQPAVTVHGPLTGATAAALRITPDPRAEEYEVKVTGTGGYTRTVRACAVELLPVDGLAAGSSYTVQARVRSDVGWSACVPVRLSTRSGGTAPVPPAPTGVTATVTGGVTTLAWNPVAGAEGYLVTQLDGGSRVSVALLTTASFVLGVEGEVATNVYVVAALTSGGLGPDSAAVTAPGTPTPRTVTVTPAQTAPDATGVIPYTESGAWLASSLVGADGEPTRYSNAVGAYATWSPRLAAAGTYQVEIWVPVNSGTSTSVRYDIAYDGGTATLTVNQLAHSGVWYPLGAWPFAAGHAGTVRLTFTGGSGYARAGAVRFTPQ